MQETFGQWLMNERIAQGLTREELTEMLGLGCNTLWTWETERFNPPIETARYIIRRLGGELIIKGGLHEKNNNDVGSSGTDGEDGSTEQSGNGTEGDLVQP